MLPLTRVELLKSYKPSEIFNTQQWQELDPNVTNKGYPVKVLIVENIKNINTLPPSVEVLISDSLEHLKLDETSNLKVIICSKLQELNYVPECIEQLIVHSCKTIDFSYRHEKLIKLYADSLTNILYINLPNLEYLSLNSIDILDLERTSLKLKYVSLKHLKLCN